MQSVRSHIFFFGSFFLIVSLLMIACEEEGEQSVDQEYLDSQEYSSFKENADDELKKNAQASKTLSQDFQKISNCASAELFSIPLKTNESDLEKWVQEVGDDCQLEKELRTITLLGKQQIGEISLQLVLLQRQTVYRDDEIIAVTFDDDELLSFMTVGIFQKNPTREIVTDLSIERDSQGVILTSVTNRSIKYPIDQENEIETLYKVDNKGGIQEL